MRHVLIIEDNATDIFILQMYLAKLRFMSSVVTNVFSIIDYVNQDKTDIIITDLHMPVVSGIEVIRQVRSVDKDIPIIVLTANTTEAARMDSFKAGANYYMTKPYTMSDLRTVLTNLSNNDRTKIRVD